MNRSLNKKPLCTFINNCRSFKQTKTCEYRHDQCSFGAKCNNINECKYYHPEKAQGSLSKPKFEKSQKDTPCKFGSTCKKKLQGKCFFNHDMPPTNAFTQNIGKKEKKEKCNRGAACQHFKKGTCRYIHDEPFPQEKNTVLQKKQTSNQQIFFEEAIPLSKSAFKPEKLQELEEKQCRRFLQNMCPDELSCRYEHLLTLDKSVKRVLHTSYDLAYSYPQDSRKSLISMIEIQKTLIYCILQPLGNQYQKIGFYQLDQKLTALKPVSMSDFIDRDGIVALYSDDNLLIYKTVRNQKIKILNILEGSLQQLGIPSQKQHQNIVGIVMNITEESKTLMIATNTCVLITNSQMQLQVLIEIEKGAQYTVFKKFHHAQEQIFVLGDTSGTLTLINEKFETLNMQLKPSKAITDLSFSKLHSKPFIYISTSNRETGSSAVFVVDLLVLDFVEVLTSNEDTFKNISCIYDKVFLGVKNGLLIYQSYDFGTPMGIIPICGEIQSQECFMKEGFVFLIEQIRNIGILSGYRVRKPDGFVL